MSETLNRRGALAVSATAGIVGPLLFAAGFLVQPVFRRGEYNATTEVISDLEAGPGGWVQQVNFVVFGLLLIAFAVGLHRCLRRSRWAVAGPAMLAGNGVGMVIAGVFPMREDAAGLTYDPTGVHTINGAIFFLTIGAGLIVLSRRLTGDPGFRDLSGYLLATGIALLALFVVLSVLTRPAEAPLHPWLGLAQRIALATWLLAILLLAARLRRQVT
ncbi:DUF998 domain-containing protein [Actinophytocola sp.]|uniref:DUF998 domain-containing protein n=1 Tax=Actinophytocola sp. TaxID=1872138 RepID=UPI002D7FE604|nr:DUF998 domain-containing protein [Actinophytocola sp.]HET9144425.1 DUF998 domain-containing protein [Actinophytocola sp.]